MRIEAFTKVDNRKVTWEEIKAKRDSLEQAPLSILEYGEFDVDTISLERMRIALEAFDYLPTLIENKLAWKLADNSIILVSKEELATINEEIKKQIAIRAALLHYMAEKLRVQLPDVTAYVMNKPESWGL